MKEIFSLSIPPAVNAKQLNMKRPPSNPFASPPPPPTSVSSADIFEVYTLLSMNVVKLSAAPTVPQEAVAL